MASKKIGARARVWWLPTDELDQHDPESPFFSAPSFGSGGDDSLDIEDTDEALADAIAGDRS
ncbi:hypothetical protein ACTG0T_10235 [Halococcus morrhuae DSM 1307]|uniref:hypothetical protein n=1 Tax=Halococcus morrhuae TaxID=2250 RepID=UPI001266F403|nr:hypothetical protein [Halococcus morrhuae]